MIRAIDGFHLDQDGEWVAELSCLHDQHVRDRPPFFDRPWTQTEAGRARRLGTGLDCPLCDRAELPDGLVVARTAGPWSADEIPAGLRRAHRVAERTWGLVRVLDGALGIAIDTAPRIERRLRVGDEQTIPPIVEHELRVDAPVMLAIDFLVRA